MLRTPTPDEVDTLVARRDPRARIAIKKFLRDHASLPVESQPAFEWYRRLSLYREGYLLAARASRRSVEARWWTIRFLNLMGASEFALAELKRLRPRTPAERNSAAYTLLANHHFEAALEHFKVLVNCSELERLPQMPHFDSLVRDQPLLLIGTADCLSELKRPDLAHPIAEAVERATPKPLNRAIAIQVQGEYYAQSGDFEAALDAFARARALMPGTETCADLAFLNKWTLYVHGRMGDPRAAAERLRALAAELRDRHWREEIWIHIYVLIAKLGQLHPVEAVRLALYPGLDPKLRSDFGLDKLSSAGISVGTRAPLHVDYARRECHARGRVQPRLTKEIELAAVLAIMGDWGLGSYKMATLLWPERPFDLPFIQARVTQLRERLKAEWKLDTRAVGPRIILAPEAREFISVSYLPASVLPGFLVSHKEFTAGELQRRYGLSLGARHALLNTWLESRWIRKTGRARATRYEVIGDAP